jgi:uncharacterized protein YndB with AHSA1/START domain
MKFEFSLERTVLIRATRQTVFRYFTDSPRFASWWGEGSRIDPRPGGEVRIVYPGNEVALGKVLEISEPERVVFTYGYENPSKPIPPGGSLVSVTFSEEKGGTRVRLVHEVADAKTRDVHVWGWRFQLSLFANVAANEQHREAARRIDAWCEAWNGRGVLDVTPDVTFRDVYACITGAEELASHIEAARVHMPLTLARSGEPRLCQGTALCGWTASASDGTVKAAGTNVYEFTPEGRICSITGFAQ